MRLTGRRSMKKFGLIEAGLAQGTLHDPSDYN
jgi:hypothetical protein